MEKKIIKVDIDGVLRNFVGSVNHVYDKYYPNFWRMPVTEWDLSLFYQIKEEIWDFIFRKHAQEIFLKYAQCHHENISSLLLFAEANPSFEIKLVTANKEPAVVDATLLWLAKTGLDIFPVVFEKNKTLIKGDFLIDDYIKNLQESAREGEIPMAITRPWNRHWPGHSYDTMQEVLDEIVEIVKSNVHSSEQRTQTAPE